MSDDADEADKLVRPAEMGNGRKATVTWSEGNDMLGYVEGEYFHVHDHMIDGVSERELTDSRPNVHPMPLSLFEEHKARLTYHDVPELLTSDRKVSSSGGRLAWPAGCCSRPTPSQ